MERITQKQLKDWRFKRILYLEQVTVGNLIKMKSILGELRDFEKTEKLTGLRRNSITTESLDV